MKSRFKKELTTCISRLDKLSGTKSTLEILQKRNKTTKNTIDTQRRLNKVCEASMISLRDIELLIQQERQKKMMLKKEEEILNKIVLDIDPSTLSNRISKTRGERSTRAMTREENDLCRRHLESGVMRNEVNSLRDGENLLNDFFEQKKRNRSNE